MNPPRRVFSELEFKNSINRCLDDTAEAKIRAGVVRGAGARDWIKIRECLKRWESEGILRILSDPEGLPAEEPCVEMLRYIDQQSSIPGFLNWEKD